MDNVAAGARADKELVVGAEGDSVVNAIADNSAGTGREGASIDRLHHPLR